MPPNAMADCVFPEDIIISILTRLPVKSIVRFKSVCKPWLELLSSPNFKNLHRGEFSRDPKNRSFILHRTNNNSSNTLSVFKIGQNETKPTILDHPFSYIQTYMDILGCYNGLVCLGTAVIRDVIHLWNPALKLSKEIIPLEECGLGENEIVEMTSLGFGYDAARDDYKVVRIVGLHIPIFLSGINVKVVEVYSCNSDSWIRMNVDVKFNVIWTASSVNVNGNPYWMARVGEKVRDENWVIVCFDVTEMVFKFMPFSPLGDIDGGIIRLYEFNGCLGALKFYKDDRGPVESIDVWVFDDSEEIWRKNRSLECIDQFELKYVLQGLENGEIIGERDGKLFVFEPESRRVKLMVNGGVGLEKLGLCGYTESLVCFKGMKTVKARKTTRKRKMIMPIII
ncbi:hypothetical protein CASFOL_013233 [Castilleja foliolosa]|uniref:F-box domain-containing protein n=1 Tax=Castilleja foliolosa TaxID=1961234 RepID=A0ABD3DJF2_9LAMI